MADKNTQDKTLSQIQRDMFNIEVIFFNLEFCKQSSF